MKKLLVMDVEGTLFRAAFKIAGTDYASTMWQPLAHALGPAAEEEERRTHERWENLEYSNYLEWVKATIDVHRKYSLKKDTFDELVQSAEYNEGVEDFFNELNRDEWIPVLISGGFQELVRRAQDELDIEYGFGACAYTFDEYGYLQSYQIQPSDFSGKVGFLKNMLSEFNLNMKTDWVFVGDGKNDVEIAKKAPLAFCITPHEQLKNVPGIIEIQSFMEILPYLCTVGSKKTATEPQKAMEQVSDMTTPESEIELLRRQVKALKKENRSLKEKVNRSKMREIKQQQKKVLIEVTELDYQRTPIRPLPELLKEIKVAFFGLDENALAFQRLSKQKDLHIVSGISKTTDNTFAKESEFVFVFKNFVAHSALWHAFADSSQVPCCYLKEHTNEDLLENAMANVLYRYFFG